MEKINLKDLSELDFQALKSLDADKINAQINRGEFLLGPEDEVTKEIARREIILNAHKERIEKYTNRYNFIGLSEGFKKLQWQKIREIWFARILASVCWVALIFVPYELMRLMVEPVAFFKSFGFLIEDDKVTAVVTAYTWKLAIPFLTIEFILLYFLRIQLINIKSCSAQLLQINLRQSLCQFIQEYASHSKEIKGADSQLLDRFENLIFSPIVAKESDIPPSLDGINQLVDLFKTKNQGG